MDAPISLELLRQIERGWEEKLEGCLDLNPDLDLGIAELFGSTGSPLHEDLDLGFAELFGSTGSPLHEEQCKTKESSNTPKRKSLSLSLKKPCKAGKENAVALGNRFGSPVSNHKLAKAKEGVVPSNTKAANKWALGNFQNWAEARNKRVPEDPVPTNLFESHDAELVCKWLCYYVQETRREDGKPYPSRTLKQLLCGLKRVMESNKVPFNIFDRSNLAFHDLRLVCDSVSRDLLKQGVGASVQHAQVISHEHEGTFWEMGLMGYCSPEALQNAVFFYVGLNFVLRGGDEQHTLKQSQFTRFPADGSYSELAYYEYVENGSKNRQGRFGDVQCQNKVVTAFAQPGSQRCVVKLLDFYLSKLPLNTDVFYLRPCATIPVDPSKPWFSKQNVGINKLREKLPQMSEKAKLPVRYTNHSLRASGISRMYRGGVPEKTISEKSGHKSVKGLRTYERTTVSQDRAACGTIANPNATFKETEKVVSNSECDEPDCKKPKLEPDVRTCEELARKIMPSFLGTCHIALLTLAVELALSLCCILVAHVCSVL